MRRSTSLAVSIAVVFAVGTGTPAAVSATRPVADSSRGGVPRAIQPMADVGWPPSTGLLVGEVVTGGAGASDEWIELYNAGSTVADLAGLELAYATASGGTVSRRATWATPTEVAPGGRYLLANAAGIHAAIADLTYNGGLAATGAAVVLRPVGGTPIDSLAWGDATSAFVEGSPGPAPVAGQSIERLPGGAAGNGQDTNDNLADTQLQSEPVPEGLDGAPPLPTPAPTATPAPTPGPTPTPTPVPTPTVLPTSPPDTPEPPTPSPQPTATISLTPTPVPSTTTPTPEPPCSTPTPDVPTPTPSPTPVPSPTATPTPDVPTPTPEPTRSPTPVPSPTATPTPDVPTPTPEPTRSPTPVPSPTATPTPDVPTPTPEPTPSSTPQPSPSATPTPTPMAFTPIGDARLMAEGTEVTVFGRLTTPLGLTESGRGAFVQDPTGGIALYLGTGEWPAIATGGTVIAVGTVDARYGQASLRVDGAGVRPEDRPLTPTDAIPIASGSVGEPYEGLLVQVVGRLVGDPTELTDALATWIDDGSGELRVVAPITSGVTAAMLADGAHVVLTGVLGQRDSSGTGMEGYRLYLRSPADVRPAAEPTPTPGPTETPVQTPAPTGSPAPTGTSTPTAGPSEPSLTPSPTPTPTTSPSPSGDVVPIAAARRLSVGSVVTVRGVVTARMGRILDEHTVVIQDPTGGIPVRLKGRLSPRPGLGERLLVRGRLHDPYGNLELRMDRSDTWSSEGAGPELEPRSIAARQLGEGTEGSLVRLRGVIRSVDRSRSGSISIEIEDDTGLARVFVHRITVVPRRVLERGRILEVTGIAGQRATGRGRSDGYRVWPRSTSDLRLVGRPEPSPTSAPTPSGDPSADPTRDRGSPTPRPGDPEPIPIAAALRRHGHTVTLEGIATTSMGLLDSDGRRLVLQDETAAILVRLSDTDDDPALKDRLRVTGIVATYYGAPQLEVAHPPAKRGRGSLPEPARLTSSPIAAGLEWRLGRAYGTIIDVERDGDSWRAGLRLPAGGVIPVRAGAASGIDAARAVEGASAEVIGIIRRAHPQASDQRFGLVPRSLADVRISSGTGDDGGGPDTGAGSGDGSGPGAGGPAPVGGSDTGGDRSAANRGAAGAVALPADAAIGDLARFEGQLVRVGGRVRAVAATRLELEDGTGRTGARFPAGAERLLAAVTPGEVVNVIGLVGRADRQWLIEARTETDLARLGAPASPAPHPSSPRSARSASPAPAGPPATAGGPSGAAGPPLTGLVAVGLLLLAGALLAVGVAARRRPAGSPGLARPASGP